MSAAGLPIHKPRVGNGVRVREVDISFLFNSTSDPTDIRDPNKDIASVVYSATSIYTITFNYPVQHLLSAKATVQLATVADVVPQWGPCASLEGTSTDFAIALKLATGASAATAPSADADNRAHCSFVLELSPNDV